MANYTAARGETIPISVFWFWGSPVTGGSALAEVLEVDTGLYLDWDDLQFKASPGTQKLALTNLGAGNYGRVGGLALPSTNLSIDTSFLHVDFSGTSSGIPDLLAQDVFSLTGGGIVVPALEPGTDIWRRVNADIAATLGEVVTFTDTSTGSAYAIKAVFDIESRQAFDEVGLPIQVDVPTLTMRDADLPAGISPAKGDTALVRGVTWTVIHQPRDDGRGGWTLDMRK